jgi:hypothetical protein
LKQLETYFSIHSARSITLKIENMVWVFSFLMFISSCVNNDNVKATTRENEPVKQYYKDIDIYKLEGIDEINTIAYPSVEIQEENNKRIVIFNVAEGSSYKYEYTNERGIWATRFTSKGDTNSVIYTCRFIQPNRIIDLDYTDSNSSKLFNAIIVEDNREVMYTPTTDVFIDPKIENVDQLPTKTMSKHERSFNFDDSILTVVTKTTDPDEKLRYTSKKCFVTKQYTYFWWMFFGFATLREINCVQ